MEKKSQDFSMEDVLRLAQSPAARQLMAALQAKDPKALDKTISQAAAGDYSSAQRGLEKLLADPALRELLRQLGG